MALFLNYPNLKQAPWNGFGVLALRPMEGTVAMQQMGAKYASIAVEQYVGEAVAVGLERPWAGRRLVVVLRQRHRPIVAEGGRRDQCDSLWRSALLNTTAGTAYAEWLIAPRPNKHAGTSG
jgi:hypothetical protein